MKEIIYHPSVERMNFKVGDRVVYIYSTGGYIYGGSYPNVLRTDGIITAIKSNKYTIKPESISAGSSDIERNDSQKNILPYLYQGTTVTIRLTDKHSMSGGIEQMWKGRVISIENSTVNLQYKIYVDDTSQYFIAYPNQVTARRYDETTGFSSAKIPNGVTGPPPPNFPPRGAPPPPPGWSGGPPPPRPLQSPSSNSSARGDPPPPPGGNEGPPPPPPSLLQSPPSNSSASTWGLGRLVDMTTMKWSPPSQVPPSEGPPLPTSAFRQPELSYKYTGDPSATLPPANSSASSLGPRFLPVPTPTLRLEYTGDRSATLPPANSSANSLGLGSFPTSPRFLPVPTTSLEYPHTASANIASAPIEEWAEYTTEDGTKYYHNKSTGETKWTNPSASSANIASANVASSANVLSANVASDLPPGWNSTVDPTTARTYYYNESTGEVSWEYPTAPAVQVSASPAVKVYSSLPVRKLKNANSFSLNFTKKNTTNTRSANNVRTRYTPLVPRSSYKTSTKKSNSASATNNNVVENSASATNNNVVENSASASENELPSGWGSKIDPASGNTYYYNKSTGESSWDKPTQGGSRKKRHLRTRRKHLSRR